VTKGDKAPDAVLRDAASTEVRLSELWREHPLVRVFLRHFGGNNREFPRFQPSQDFTESRKNRSLSEVFGQIPYSTEQGILLADQGTFRQEQGIS
jgi:hypothetical protein